MQGSVLFKKSAWYLITTALVIATVITVLSSASNVYKAIYLQPILGTIFILFLPGYAFTRMLFNSDGSTESIDSINRVGLSMGMSLAFISIAGLILNYSPWGISLVTVVSSLSLLTMTLSTIALFREITKRAKIR